MNCKILSNEAQLDHLASPPCLTLSLLFLENTVHRPTSGPWHLPVPVPGMFFLQRSTGLTQLLQVFVQISLHRGFSEQPMKICSFTFSIFYHQFIFSKAFSTVSYTTLCLLLIICCFPSGAKFHEGKRLPSILFTTVSPKPKRVQ